MNAVQKNNQYRISNAPKKTNDIIYIDKILPMLIDRNGSYVSKHFYREYFKPTKRFHTEDLNGIEEIDSIFLTQALSIPYKNNRDFSVDAERNLLILPTSDNTEVLAQLENKIQSIYKEHQEENWDGYNAQPMKYLKKTLEFATVLQCESSRLIESVEIVPENDGCLCFEWFKSHSKYINISVKNNTLIYHYKIGEEEGCGETNFAGKEMLIEKTKRIF